MAEGTDCSGVENSPDSLYTVREQIIRALTPIYTSFMKKLLVWIIILGAIAVGGYMYTQNGGVGQPATPSNASSTNETVNESTADDSIKNWQVLNGDGLSFSYPGELGTTYIGAKIWPPQGYMLGAGPLTCVAAGTETGASGQTASVKVNGHTYCVTKKSTTTTGTTYTQYAYAFEKEGKIVALITTLRYMQCASYVAPKKGECEAERKAFNFDTIADKIAQSFKFGKIETAPTNIVAPKGS